MLCAPIFFFLPAKKQVSHQILASIQGHQSQDKLLKTNKKVETVDDVPNPKEINILLLSKKTKKN